MAGVWEAKILDFRTFFDDFSMSFLKCVLEGKKSSFEGPTLKVDAFLGRPGGMCVARGRDREGVIRRSGPRLLKLSILGLKIFGQDFDSESSTRRHLRWGGGSLLAFRRAGRIYFKTACHAVTVPILSTKPSVELGGVTPKLEYHCLT